MRHDHVALTEPLAFLRAPSAALEPLLGQEAVAETPLLFHGAVQPSSGRYLNPWVRADCRKGWMGGGDGGGGGGGNGGCGVCVCVCVCVSNVCASVCVHAWNV